MRNIRPRSSAIIIKNDKILLMHRRKQGREYWVFPGGGIKKGETAEEAVVREVQEETGLTVNCKKLTCGWNKKGKNIKHSFFLCNVLGNDKPILGGPEKERSSSQNWYKPEWVEIEAISNLVLYPEEVKKFALANRSFWLRQEFLEEKSR